MSSNLLFWCMFICGVLAVIIFLFTIIILDGQDKTRRFMVVGWAACAFFAFSAGFLSVLAIRALDAEDHHNAQLVKQQLQVVHPEAYNIHVSFGDTLATYKASGQVCQIGFDWLGSQSAATFGSPTCSKT